MGQGKNIAWRLTSKTVLSLPGDWPVQQSKTETLQEKGAKKKKNIRRVFDIFLMLF